MSKDDPNANNEYTAIFLIIKYFVYLFLILNTFGFSFDNVGTHVMYLYSSMNVKTPGAIEFHTSALKVTPQIISTAGNRRNSSPASRTAREDPPASPTDSSGHYTTEPYPPFPRAT